MNTPDRITDLCRSASKALRTEITPHCYSGEWGGTYYDEGTGGTHWADAEDLATAVADYDYCDRETGDFGFSDWVQAVSPRRVSSAATVTEDQFPAKLRIASQIADLRDAIDARRRYLRRVTYQLRISGARPHPEAREELLIQRVRTRTWLRIWRRELRALEAQA